MNENLSISAKVKLILTKPSLFWTSIENEQGLGKVIKYIWAIIPIGILIYFIKDLILLNQGTLASTEMSALVRLSNQFGVSQVIMLFIASAAYFCFFFIASFLVLPFIHLFIKLFKGQGGFDKTYQAWVYGVTPNLFFVAIPFFNAIIPIWSFWLHITGMSKFHKISIWNVVFAQVLAYISFMIAIVIIAFGFIIGFGPLIKAHTLSPQVTWTDPQGIFQVTIPAGWHQLTPRAGLIIAAASPDNAAGFNITTIPIVSGENMDVLQQSMKAKGLNIVPATLGGQTAITETDNVNSQSTATIHGDFVYDVTFNQNPKKTVSDSDKSDEDLILQSFTFLK